MSGIRNGLSRLVRMIILPVALFGAQPLLAHEFDLELAKADTKTDAKDKTTPAAKHPGAPKHQDAQTDESSRANRGRNKMIVLGEIGLVNVLNFGVGAAAGALIGKNLALEGEIFHSDFQFLSLKTSIDFAMARLRWFVGNSFYLGFGGGGRMMKFASTSYYFNSTVGSGSTSDNYTMTVSSTDLVGEFSIGNRWQWHSFTLGCDWVGVAFPIASISYQEPTVADNDPNKEAKDTDIKNSRNSVKGSSMNFVRLHLGFAF